VIKLSKIGNISQKICFPEYYLILKNTVNQKNGLAAEWGSGLRASPHSILRPIRSESERANFAAGFSRLGTRTQKRPVEYCTRPAFVFDGLSLGSAYC
jgi:hypothetical protein